MRLIKIGKKTGKENPMFGKHHSEKTKEKIRQSLKLTREKRNQNKNENCGY